MTIRDIERESFAKFVEEAKNKKVSKEKYNQIVEI